MRPVDSRWLLPEIPPRALAEDIPALARALGVSALVARLLWLRSVRTEAEGRSFLQPRLADLTPPGVLPDVGPAADRLAAAVRSGERIAVFGDYDVDGMTGTAVLVRFLRLADADVVWAIPDRSGEGYGLSVEAVDRLADAGARVLVTVDNGISAHAAVERAVERGLDVVVTDHHLPGDSLPPALAVVNPHRHDAGPAGRDLCGCALAFKLAWAVAERLRGVSGGTKAEMFRAFLRDAVGLVALATISDVVPLRGENRILVTAGLAALRSSEHPGIRALLQAARVGSLPLTTEDVAFRLAPRLNAAGRVARPDLVVELLTATDAEEAHLCSRRLDDANAERRRIEKRVLAAAVDQAAGVLQRSDCQSLVVHGEGWHRGVIGIVAARLVDLHQRPTVVIGFDGAEGRGSCRTPDHVNLHEALSRCDEHLSRYGGHAAAAGLEIDRQEVDGFTNAFERAVRAQVGTSAPTRTLSIDAETRVEDWTLDQVEAVTRLDPFGPANPPPLFLVRAVDVAGKARLMGQGDQHLTFSLRQAQGAIRVVGFRRADAYDLVTSGVLLDVVVQPMVNEWRGTRMPELRLVDLRPSAAAPAPAQEVSPPSAGH